MTVGICGFFGDKVSRARFAAVGGLLSIFLTAASVGHSAGNGLLGQYYSDTSFTNFAGERIDPTVNFNWGTGSPGFGMSQILFSVRWTGFVTAPCSDTYTFQTTTDDGTRLWVNGVEVINQWVDQAATAVNSSGQESAFSAPVEITIP